MLKSAAPFFVVTGLLSLPAIVACEVPPADDGSEGEGEGENLGPTCSEPRAIDCEDEVFVALDMDLDGQAPGLIDSAAAADAFEVDVDATAGGFNGTEGWVYGRFTDDGLQKVEIADIDSLGSMDWDIAFRRFVIRVNSGFGGPSCVTAARTAADTDFDGLDDVPADLRFNEEKFMSDPETCTLVADGSGLGSPGVVLQNWWTYPAGCVATTGNVYILSLADGRRLKMVVDQYYAGDGAQATCNETGSAAGESARIKLRYAFFE
jgi:hypothetical protein